MNMNAMNISEEMLETVSGGLPIGRDGKSSPRFGAEKHDGIHVTSATYSIKTDFTSTNEDGIHTTSANY